MRLKMIVMTPEEEKITTRMRELLASVPTYRPEYPCYARRHANGISVAYRTTELNPTTSTHFDFQMSGDVAYVLYIQRDEKDRDKRIGQALYLAIEQLVREQGCKRIELTPSGSGKKGIWESLGFQPGEGRSLQKML